MTPRLHVLLKKEDLKPTLLSGQVVIVLDILFATSSILHALAQGTESVYPALDERDALTIGAGLDGCLRAGEYRAEALPGFLPAMPLMLAKTRLQGKSLVYCTTNGTVALRRAARAPFVYVGALLNAAALVRYILRAHPADPVLIVCSGSGGRFNLEDFYAAGHFVQLFQAHAAAVEPGAETELNDAAHAAVLLARATVPMTALMTSRVGRMFQARGEVEEIEYCARADTLDVIARLDGEVIRRISV